MSQPERVAVYSTIYPAVERFLPVWFESLRRQTDRDFDLWIGLDAMDQDRVAGIAAGDFRLRWVRAPTSAGPGQIRGKALEHIVEEYEAVVLVDSDDLLESRRVQDARAALHSADVAGCALRIMDEAGADVGAVFAPPADVTWDDLLPRRNVF